MNAAKSNVQRCDGECSGEWSMGPGLVESTDAYGLPCVRPCRDCRPNEVRESSWAEDYQDGAYDELLAHEAWVEDHKEDVMTSTEIDVIVARFAEQFDAEWDAELKRQNREALRLEMAAFVEPKHRLNATPTILLESDLGRDAARAKGEEQDRFVDAAEVGREVAADAALFERLAVNGADPVQKLAEQLRERAMDDEPLYSNRVWTRKLRQYDFTAIADAGARMQAMDEEYWELQRSLRIVLKGYGYSTWRPPVQGDELERDWYFVALERFEAQESAARYSDDEMRSDADTMRWIGRDEEPVARGYGMTQREMRRKWLMDARFRWMRAVEEAKAKYSLTLRNGKVVQTVSVEKIKAFPAIDAMARYGWNVKHGWEFEDELLRHGVVAPEKATVYAYRKLVSGKVKADGGLTAGNYAEATEKLVARRRLAEAGRIDRFTETYSEGRLAA